MLFNKFTFKFKGGLLEASRASTMAIQTALLTWYYHSISN